MDEAAGPPKAPLKGSTLWRRKSRYRDKWQKCLSLSFLMPQPVHFATSVVFQLFLFLSCKPRHPLLTGILPRRLREKNPGAWLLGL